MSAGYTLTGTYCLDGPNVSISQGTRWRRTPVQHWRWDLINPMLSGKLEVCEAELRTTGGQPDGEKPYADASAH